MRLVILIKVVLTKKKNSVFAFWRCTSVTHDVILIAYVFVTFDVVNTLNQDMNTPSVSVKLGRWIKTPSPSQIVLH